MPSRTIAKSFHMVESAPTRLSRESGNPQFQPWSPPIPEADGPNRTTLQSSCNAEWKAWLQRREEAQANNQPFNEPNPSEKE